MAQTQGFVQRLKLTGPPILAWAYIGPTPNNTTLLIVNAPAGLSAGDLAARGAMADALSAALVSQREVVAFHATSSSEITTLQIPP